jgi:hypothetical protein
MAISNCLNCNKQFKYNPANKSGKYCSCRCSSDYRSKEYISGWLNGKELGGNGFQLSQYVRNYLIEQSNNKCSKCGWLEINPNTGKVPLHIDHIDGDPFNHNSSNLRVLCPNCHSLTETFGSKNIGNGRYSRGCKHPKHTVMTTL